jgi:tRNA threonylcarbamoyladenosine biosynthesis protein TsaB
MLVLTIRTDNPVAELGLFENDKQLKYEKWQADRELSITIHDKLTRLIDSQNLSLKNLEGIVCFKGPGSFTGLRIGLTIANTLAYSFNIPIIGAVGENWRNNGIRDLLDGKNAMTVLPVYGAEPHITVQKK